VAVSRKCSTGSVWVSRFPLPIQSSSRPSSAGIREHFVETYLSLGHAGLALLHLIRAQVVLGLGTVIPRTGAELVQVTVGPAERDLEDLVDLVEKQAGC
jgi:hypothetical protein